jgi:3-methyl-2-oxobutanoate hydroxymethyltransferase
MSASQSEKKLTPPDIRARKGGVPLVCLSATSVVLARLLDPFADLLLVGDSLGVVIYGLSNTLPVTLEMMITHGAAVVRGTRHACVVVDMPFATYQESPQQAFRNAAQIMSATGCDAVKLEGGEVMADTIRFLVERGIPVVGHIGLQPQSVNVIGGMGLKEHGAVEAARVMADACAVAEAGAFATVISTTSEPVARRASEEIAIPTIGIAASPACDGQIISTEGILGLHHDIPPAYMKRYVDLRQSIVAAIAAYAEDVRGRRFPGPEHCFGQIETPTSPGKERRD